MNIARWGGLKYQSFTSEEPTLTNNEQEKKQGAWHFNVFVLFST